MALAAKKPPSRSRKAMRGASISGAPFLGAAFDRRIRLGKRSASRIGGTLAATNVVENQTGTYVDKIADLINQQNVFLESSLSNQRLQNDLLSQIVGELEKKPTDQEKKPDGKSWLDTALSALEVAAAAAGGWKGLLKGVIGGVVAGKALSYLTGKEDPLSEFGLALMGPTAIATVASAAAMKGAYSVFGGKPDTRAIPEHVPSTEIATKRLVVKKDLDDIKASDQPISSEDLRKKLKVSENEWVTGDAQTPGMLNQLIQSGYVDWYKETKQTPVAPLPTQQTTPTASPVATPSATNQAQPTSAPSAPQASPVQAQPEAAAPQATQTEQPSATGARTTGPSISQSGNTSEAIQFFVSKGWTQEQAAGIVANLHWESGGLKTDAVGDGGKAYGIAQWHPDRQGTFQRVYGKPIQQATFQEQLAYVDWELNNTEKRAGNIIRNAKTAEEAAGLTDQYYERSSGIHRQQRISLATSFMGGQIPQAASQQPTTPRAGETLNQASVNDVASTMRRVSATVEIPRQQVNIPTNMNQTARATTKGRRGERPLEEVLLRMVS